MELSPYRAPPVRETPSEQGDTGRESSDLGREPRVRVGCLLCGSRGSRLVCSPDAIAAQRAFLENFYRSRWREQNATTATDRLRFTQNYVTGIVACADCGLLYRNPRPRPQAVASAYEADRYDGAYLSAEFEVQRAWARTKIPLLEKYLTGQARPRILEVGCFVGGFLAEARDRGWDVFGIDPERDVTAFCRGRQLPVFQGTIEEAALSPASFDAVAVWNTFDQIPDPDALLKSAVRLLRNGGLFIIRVPNGACFEWAMTVRPGWPQTFRRLLDLALAWNNLLTFPYLYGYSVEQLQRLASQYGFRLSFCLPDQLSPAPPGHLTRRAALEERAIKMLCRAVAALLPRDRSAGFRLAPWLDLCFERGCVEEDRLSPAKAALGIIPVYEPLAFEDTDSDCRGVRWDGEGG